MKLPAMWPLPGLLLALAWSAAPAATRVVDDDRAQCPAAGFTEIQAAVDASAPGDTVRVCAGLYPERVLVARRVHLHGAQQGIDARTRAYGAPGESVVRSPVPFTVSANWVTVDGFSIEVQLDEEGEGRGIGLAGYGQRIRNNLFEDSVVTGIMPFNVTGQYPVTIRRNQFRGRWGISADSETSANNLLIADNLFVDASVSFTGAPHAGIRVLRNEFRWDPAAPTGCITSPQHQCRPLITLDGTYDAVVANNLLVKPDDRAISVSAGYNVLVEANVLRGGIGDGIWISGPSDGVRVLGNTAGWFRHGAGIRVDHASSAVVEDNRLRNNRMGLVLADSIGNRAARNVVSDNREIGIEVTLSSGNTLVDNQAHGNLALDCRDLTGGSGSFGTANTWTGNVGTTSAPAGLCTE